MATLFGCGGGCGGSEPAASEPTPSDPSSPITPVDPTPNKPSNITVSGNVSGLDIRTGTVKLYDYSGGSKGEELAIAILNSIGDYSIEINALADNSYILVCLDTGIYRERIINEDRFITTDKTICGARAIEQSDQLTINVNPWTQYGLSYQKYLMKNGATQSASSVVADDLIKSIFLFDPQTITYTGLYSLDDFNSESGKASLLLTAISRQTFGYSVDARVPAATTGMSSLDFHYIASVDIESDGLLDGFGFPYEGSPSVQLGMGLEKFTGATYTLDSARNAIKYLNSEINYSTITVTDALEFENEFASNTNSFLGADISDLVSGGIDPDAPIITSNLYYSRLINGTYEVVVSAEDFLGIKSLSLYIEGALVASNTDLEELTYTYNTELAEDGVRSIRVVATDLNDNEAVFESTFSVRNADFTVSYGGQLVRHVDYTISGHVSSRTKELQSLEINGSPVSFSASSYYSYPITLEEGVNVITYTITATDGETEVFVFELTLDSIGPEITQSTYTNEILYKTDANEPVLETQRYPELTKPIYIDQFHKSLNGAASDIATLNSLQQPYIRFEVSDSQTAGSDLYVRYTYYKDDLYIRSGVFARSAVEDDQYHIPLSSEWLSDDWHEFEGVHKIVVEAKDEASNYTTSIDYEFKVHYAVPTIEVDTGLVFGAREETLQVEAEDFIGFDNVFLEIAGQELEVQGRNQPHFGYDFDFTFDLTGEQHGPASAFIKAYESGEEVFSERIDYMLDATPASLTVESEVRVGIDSPLSGLVVDDESGLSKVYVNEELATYDPSNNTFRINLSSFDDGFHDITIETENGVGLTSTAEVSVTLDTQVPRFSYYYPSTGYLYDVRRQHVPNTPPITQQFSQMGGSESFYMTPENTQLNGTPLTVDALKAGGYVFINAQFVDRWSAGAETAMSDLTITYDYRMGDDITWIFEGRVAPNNNGILILPLTTEYFGDDLLQTDRRILHDLRIWVHDKSGNYIVKDFQFSVAYDADSTY